MIMKRDESWPLGHRALSFAITIGVTLGEFALVAVPLGLVLWLTGAAPPRAIADGAAVLAAIFSLTISIYGHVRPVRIPGGVLNGGLR
jgi:hypothetical protein